MRFSLCDVIMEIINTIFKLDFFNSCLPIKCTLVLNAFSNHRGLCSSEARPLGDSKPYGCFLSMAKSAVFDPLLMLSNV